MALWKVAFQPLLMVMLSSLVVSKVCDNLSVHRRWCFRGSNQGNSLLPPCSCCVDEVSAQHVDADCVIHFGPSCLTR